MKHVKSNGVAAAVALALTLPAGSAAFASSLTDDATGTLQLRNFYFNRDFRDPGAQSKAEEWAQGFIFRGSTGYTHGSQGFGLETYAGLGIKLDSSDERAGTALWPNSFGDEGRDTFSEIAFTAKAKVSSTELKVGGLMPKLPIASSGDSRLLPQVYYGAALAMGEIQGLDVQAGQLREVNYRNSSNRQDIIATVGGSSDRFNYLGANYKFNADNTVVGLWRSELDDVYGQTLANVIHTIPVGDWKLNANLAYFDTRDNGSQALDIDHQLTSLMLSAGTGAHTFRLGYQYSDGDTAFPYLTETDPYIANYVQVLDFARPGEKSWQARYDVNFATLGVPGLTAIARYIRGDNFEVGGESAKEWERDIDFIYTVQSGALKNVSVRWRNAMVRSDATRDINENRLILAYTLPLG